MKYLYNFLSDKFANILNNKSNIRTTLKLIIYILDKIYCDNP